MNTKPQTGALVLLSGGIDSATCLYWAKKEFAKISAITFNCYDRGKQEKRAAVQIAKAAGFSKLLEVDIPFIREYSDFTNATHRQQDDRLPTYVPSRNLIFYSIASHFAESLAIKWIVGGHNGHDGSFFKDASADYLGKINSLLTQGSPFPNHDPCVILTPLSKMNRKEIVRLALDLGVPLELTWSCHWKSSKHCGMCYACRQRLEAFNSLGIRDPVFDESFQPNRAFDKTSKSN